MKNEFTIELCSNLDYEGMTIDVCYNLNLLATVNYDRGIDHLEVEIPATDEQITIPFQEFLDTLERAKALAIKCAKEDEELKKKGLDF